MPTQCVLTEVGRCTTSVIAQFLKKSCRALFWGGVPKRIADYQSGNFFMVVATGAPSVREDVEKDRPAP